MNVTEGEVPHSLVTLNVLGLDGDLLFESCLSKMKGLQGTKRERDLDLDCYRLSPGSLPKQLQVFTRPVPGVRDFIQISHLDGRHPNTWTIIHYYLTS